MGLGLSAKSRVQSLHLTRTPNGVILHTKETNLEIGNILSLKFAAMAF